MKLQFLKRKISVHKKHLEDLEDIVKETIFGDITNYEDVKQQLQEWMQSFISRQ